MINKLMEIFSTVLKIDEKSIVDSSSPDNLESWDSLRHIHLVAALEEAFDIEFTDDEIVEMLNFKIISLILEQKLDETKSDD